MSFIFTFIFKVKQTTKCLCYPRMLLVNISKVIFLIREKLHVSIMGLDKHSQSTSTVKILLSLERRPET